MTTTQHLRRIGLLLLAATALMSWLTAHTDVLFADGLRYIAQAKAIDHGSWRQGMVRSVDHPIYPLAITGVHRLLGGNEPRDWQTAAQVAASAAGVLLVIPMYLISLELCGASCAWLACFLFYLLPFNGHVLADALSESTFLLFWSCALWSSLRFFRGGNLIWLPLLIAFTVLAYLTRTEGLILPVALLATLIYISLYFPAELPRSKRWWAIGVLVLGPLLMAGPFMIMKGSISTKPSFLRIFGVGSAAPAMAVERERPLDPDQTTIKTVFLATKAMARSVEGSTSVPLLMLAPLGIAAGCRSALGRRQWRFLGAIIGLTSLAMIRLHAMSGYCTPRHAMVVGWILIPAGACGLNRLSEILANLLHRRTMQGLLSRKAETLVTCLALGSALAFWGPGAVAPIDLGFHGYRQAGEWLAQTARPGENMVDPKGFSIFYSGRSGYSFATLARGVTDPSVRWVVAHESLIYGPWDYSKAIRTLVGDRRPIRVFPATPAKGVSKVYLYDLAQPALHVEVGVVPKRKIH